MEVRLTFDDDARGAPAGAAGGQAGHAASLYRWLSSDTELRGLAEVSVGSVPSPRGAMGGVPELLDVVLANSIALGGLVVAVATWRGSRPQAPQVRIERDGTTVTVRDGSAETVERILRVLGTDASGPAPGPDGGEGE